MPNPDSFIPTGWKALEKVRGDLTGAGRSDALVVASPPSAEEEKLGEGEPRTVLLLKQDAAGLLTRVAENRRIVPCARCGGLAGDPYAYSRIEKGGFTLSISAGSRERWADDYSFRYRPDEGTWVLDKVMREVTDTESDQLRKLELTDKDFGHITFEDFDPVKLARP
ncbi:hypothetical protein HF319_00810 [Xanthomonas sp. Kuri4-1]